MFLHELALELGMPVAEMCARMSARELCVDWPLYFEAREGLREDTEPSQPTAGRTMGGGR